MSLKEVKKKSTTTCTSEREKENYWIECTDYHAMKWCSSIYGWILFLQIQIAQLLFR